MIDTSITQTQEVQQTMKAARVHQQGKAEFRIEEVPVPKPGPGQVLIRVEAAGVNFSDIKRRRGDAYPFVTEFPFVPGGEIAGTIVAHGLGVDAPLAGTRVLALAGTNGFGGYAQYAVAYAQTAIPLPDMLDFDTASVLLVAGCTAKVMLTQTARLQEGESILIPAAAGGVGSFAIQIARQLGAAKIIAAVGDAAKRDAAVALGADEVVIYTTNGWPSDVLAVTEGNGVNVGLEASGGSTLGETIQCLASFGRLVVYGAASGLSAHLDEALIDHLLYAPAPNQSITGFNIGGWFMERPAIAGAALHELIQDVIAGSIRIPSIQSLSLTEAARAHEMLESRQTSGKLILKPWV
jgi:NADPH:quinone reductase-like Zn-dependent oxidoreductase